VIQNKNQQNHTAMGLNNTTLLNSRSLRLGSIWFHTNNHMTLAQLTLILLTWRIWWVSNNASRWQMGCNWVFKRL